MNAIHLVRHKGAYRAQIGFAAWAMTTVDEWPNHYENIPETKAIRIED